MDQIIQLVGSTILACVPAIIWGHIYYSRKPKGKRLTALTFIVGALSVFPILIYKFLWQFFPWMNAFRFADGYRTDIIGFSNIMILPLSIIITFMIVGIIEEVMKMISVKVVDDDEIKTIDDSIEFFIIAALGFSFTENILYFYNIWLAHGSGNLFLPFLFRSSFSTFAHLLFSGVLGYYYGTAHFAKPILQEELRKNRKHWTVWMSKVFFIKKETLFHEERLLEGLIISIGLHALFNILLEMNLTFMIVPFLVSGYLAINYLFDKKESHKNYGKYLTHFRNHPHPKSGVFFKKSILENEA